MILKLLFFVLTFVVVNSVYVSYENYKVYSVIPKTEEQVQILTDLKKDGYDVWNDVVNVGSDVRIMVSPSKNEEFVKYNQTVGLNAALKISNVQKLINDQLTPCDSKSRSSNHLSYSWSRFHTLSDIHGWMDELAVNYPAIVNTVTIGQSLEGRPLKGVIIDFKRGTRQNPVIGMIEGGIHAREWISPATVTWIIKEFLTSTDPDVRFMAEEVVWHIFPVVNPDGYVYTFTDNRMWRKNRNTANFATCSSVNNDLSNGIDLNRNFNFLWMTTGASSNPCSETFAGSSPSSELEAQAISRYVTSLKHTGNFVYYFAFHSYSQMILIPYSHVTGNDVLLAKNYADLYEIAARGADKLKNTHGTPYTFGTSAEILYAVSGSSFDWVKGVADIPIVYLFELRDVGEYGFLVPPEQIIPNNEEIMACLVEMDKTTRTLGYYTGSASSVRVLVSLIFGLLLLVTVQ